MASNQYVNKVIVNNQTVVDLTNDTVTPNALQMGYTAHDKSGELIVGTGLFTNTSDGSEAGPIFDLTAEGYAEQDGTPTSDNPIDIQVVRGRNLWPYESSWSNDNGGSAFGGNKEIELPAGTYTLTFNCPSTSASAMQIFVYDLNDEQIYLVTRNNPFVTDGKFTQTFTIATDGSKIRLYFNGSYAINSFQIVKGSTTMPYVPYGYVGLDVYDDDTHVSTTSIPLPFRGWVASLPDDTADILALDGAGRVVWEEKTEKTTQAVTDNVSATVGVDAMSSTGQIADGATVLYKLTTSVVEHCGYVNLPDIPVGASISIPELDNLNVEYFIDDSIVKLAQAWYLRSRYEMALDVQYAVNEIDEIDTQNQQE